MPAYSRVTHTGWAQGDDTSASSRVTPTGWFQVAAAVAASTSFAPPRTFPRPILNF